MIKRILVTGGAGFLGSHLCERLVNQGHEVTCLDNLFTSQKNNIEHLEVKPNFKFVRHDVTESYKFEIDEIYNLACPAAPGHYQYNPIKTLKTSVLGTMHALGLGKRLDARVLQASTSEVYGDPDVHPQPESYRGNVNPIGPRSCYDEGKRAAETLMFDYRRMQNSRIKVVRIFNTYGPRMRLRDGRVVPNFIQQALRGEPLTVYGDGSQTRSFQFVDDLVEGVYRLLQSNFTEPVNIGNPQERTIEEFAQIINELTGNQAGIIRKDLRTKDDPQVRQPDITRARTILGWEPQISVQDGLQRTIPWFRKQLQLLGELA